MQTKPVGHRVKLNDAPPTQVPTKRIHHQTQPKIAAAPAPPMVTHQQKRIKVASPVFVKQAYAVPKYTKFKLPNGHGSIKLTDIYHYYRLRIN